MTLRLRLGHAAELGLSGVVAYVAKAVLAAHLLDWQPGIGFAQKPVICSAV
jgi:hypothetical protein